MAVPDFQWEDRLRQLEPPYKSKGEAQVGRLLDRYGLPFYYEHPLLVFDRGRHRVWHPDFTLPQYDNFIIEYAGMSDIPDYLEGIIHKKDVFKRNQIPALFLYPDDLKGPHWPADIMDQLTARLLPINPYQARSIVQSSERSGSAYREPGYRR